MTYNLILKDCPASCIAVAEKRALKKGHDITVADDPLITIIYLKVRDTYLQKRDTAKERARTRRLKLTFDSNPSSPINIITP